jgi:hypothetical protein
VTDRHLYEWWDQFSLPVVPDVLTERVLLVEVVRDGSHRTAIRVDAQVVWLPAKQAAERITPDATVVTVAPQVGVGPLPVSARKRLADWPVTVTDPATVARIAAVVDGQPVFPPGIYSCPADYGWGIRLTFRVGLDGLVLALVAGDESDARSFPSSSTARASSRWPTAAAGEGGPRPRPHARGRTGLR